MIPRPLPRLPKRGAGGDSGREAVRAPGLTLAGDWTWDGVSVMHDAEGGYVRL